MSSTKRIGVAVDFSPCSRKAVRWAIDNLARKGEHLILVAVRPDAHYESGEMQLWETTGSPLIPLRDITNAIIMKKYHITPDAETLDIITTASNEKEIVVLMKIYWGDARVKLCESVDNIPLDSLVLGNRGLGKIKRVLMGSVSNYVVNNAPCPVTVVKSND